MRRNRQLIQLALLAVLGWVLGATAGCATNEVPDAPDATADGGTDIDGNSGDTGVGDTTGEGDAGDGGPSDTGISGDGGPSDTDVSETGNGDTGVDAGPDDGGTGARECQSDEDCSGGNSCIVDRSGGSVDLRCSSTNSGGSSVGESCGMDGDCASNLCLDGTCSKPCVRPVQCGSDGAQTCTMADVDGARLTVCRPAPATQCQSAQDCNGDEICVAQKSGGTLSFICRAPWGFKRLGQECNQDANCRTKLCVDGRCRAPCSGNADCSAAEAYSCKSVSVDLGGGASDTASICVPPTPCNEADACKVAAGEVCWVDRTVLQGKSGSCRPPNPGGGSLGTICQKDGNCAANLCYEGRFQTFCSLPCINDSDCTQAGYHCEQKAVPDKQGSDRQITICVQNDPKPCTTRTDCSGGNACAVVVNEDQTALERVCVPNPQGSPTGASCNADADCLSNVCINNACAAPCRDRSVCGSGQECKTNNITKSGLTGSFRVCETLPREECTSTGTCSDATRICSQIGQTSPGAPAKAYCQFPNSGGKNLGSTCSASSQCRSALCMSDFGGNQSPFVGECSKACTSTSQCGGGQLCTSFPTQNTQVGICQQRCSTNADCASFSNGVCKINENRLSGRPYSLDTVCRARDTSGNSFEQTCQTNGDCASGFCIGTYTQQSCSSNANCSGGFTCETNPSTNQRVCAAVRCSRLCINGTDCTGGPLNSGSQANFGTCSNTVQVTLTDGSVRNVSACAP